MQLQEESSEDLETLNHYRYFIRNEVRHLLGFRGLYSPFSVEYQGREFTDTVYTFGLTRPGIESWTFRSRTKLPVS